MPDTLPDQEQRLKLCSTAEQSLVTGALGAS
jgi:hypothetical protein